MIDRIYTMEACEAGHPDEGLVGITIQAGEVHADAVLTAEEALMLADRLTRAAHLVLEAGEDEPETETDREYQPLSRPRPAGDENG